jgi:hypothetical protein
MGVREDVPPFVWRDPLSDEFRGFFWDICTAALVRAGYVFETVTIETEQRTDLLKTGNFCKQSLAEGETCPEADLETVDLLCDPTTITLERMKLFALGNGHFAEPQGTPAEPLSQERLQRFVFSPVLFLANGAYIRLKDSRSDYRDKLARKLTPRCSDHEQIKAVFCQGQREVGALSWILPPGLRGAPDPVAVNWPEACAAIIDALSGDPKTGPGKDPRESDTSWWPPQIWPEPIPEKPQFEIWGYVKGATIAPIVVEAAKRAPDTVGICPRSFESHTALTEAFCKGEVMRYFGDVDLVRARVDAYRRAHPDNPCPADETPSAQGTYEPYALVLSHDRDDFPEAFNLALYSMFSDGTIAQLFDGRFGQKRRSQYLETLFRINSLRGGRAAATWRSTLRRRAGPAPCGPDPPVPVAAARVRLRMGKAPGGGSASGQRRAVPKVRPE